MIIATLLLIILAYPLYQFGLRRAEDRAVARRYLPAFITFGLLLLLTAVFALNDLIDVFAPREMQVIERVQTLEALATDEDTTALFVGAVGELPVGVTIPRIPQTRFPLQLQDGVISVVIGEGLLVINWPEERGSRVLIADQRVVVLGTLQSAVPIEPSSAISEDVYISAQTIYAGSYDAYIAFLPRFAVIPGVTLLLSLLAALAVLIGPVLVIRRLPT